ncbi:general transcription and DNA repair factor IIH helicase subunit XPD [Skeletonema marinoi]|uniref:DNA 5'-3' helicase n=1 Tax=Skeletonema marinoi TaxID=267567 RepID=A0AAD9DI20_9STRA|nr:general transcription and DNA repair factor IIH helicase subunit XPD [Skeletonema marinoi]
MRFNLEGLEVFFPYDRIYLEQYQYMRSIKQTLDAGGHCLLEMPTGTGKTVCLLSLITSYQLAHPNCGKLVYCTRTVPEMNSVMEELGTVFSYRSEQLRLDREAAAAADASNTQQAEDVTMMDVEESAKSSTTNNNTEHQQEVRKRKRIYGPKKNGQKENMGPIPHDGGAGGSGALALCLSSRRNMCIHERVLRESDREGIDAACRSMTAPWALERAKTDQTVETCQYFDGFQAAGEATSMPSGVYDLEELKKWGKGKNWCPYYLTRQAINHATVLVFNYQYMLDPKVAKMVSKELESESIIVFDEAHNIDSVCIEALPATRSLGRLSSEVSRMKASDSERLQREYQNLVNGLVDQGLLEASANEAGFASNVLNPDVINEAVPGNIRRAEHFISFMKKIVEHLKTRLLTVAVATYSEGLPKFAIIMEPNGSSIPGASDPVIQLACLDASLAIAPLFKRFGSVIITSGTLSPIDLYPKLLQFEPRVSESFNMSTFRPCIRPLVITRGSDQLPVSTKFDDRGDMGVVRNYGSMLVELCSSIPDGVVAFFTSYSYMESIISEWDGMGILRQLTKSKLVFIETKDVVETTLALDNFRRACDSGRGAVFLSVARGSHILRARLEYLQTNYQIREQDFLNFDALRQASQCVGRVIRSKIDYGLMIFADSRYNRHDKRTKLPGWIQNFLGDGQLNLSTDTAIAQVKHFLRVMAQPVDQNKLKEVLLSLEEVEAMNPPTQMIEAP